MDAQQEIDQQWGLERWQANYAGTPCPGCRFLAGRVFFTFEGPRPELHPNCRCTREPVNTEGLTGVDLIRLVLEARANGRAADFLVQEAKRLPRGGGVSRVDTRRVERRIAGMRGRVKRRMARRLSRGGA